jgi:hypothetical protein
MTSAYKTEQVVLDYWRSWQLQDWELMRRCLADDFRFDSAVMQFTSPDEIVEFCRQGPTWRKVFLIDSLFAAGQGALLYEGIDVNESRVRVAEFYKVANDCITELQLVMTVLE